MLEMKPLCGQGWAVFSFAATLSLGLGGCDGEGDEPAPDQAAESASPPSVTIVATSPEGICNLGAGPFSTNIDNPWFPLPAGQVAELEGAEDGERVYLRTTVGTDTVAVAGVETRVLEEYEEHDGELVEISENYFAQALDGTVCYFGEDVDIYENGKVTAHDGAWRAGEGVNQPGIQMPAHPVPGLSYAQEIAPGLAEDHADYVAAGAKVETPYGTFDDTLDVREWSTLEPDSQSEKVYGYGVGLLLDDGVALASLSTR